MKGSLVNKREMQSATTLFSPSMWLTWRPKLLFSCREQARRPMCFAMGLDDDIPFFDQATADELSEKMLMVGYVSEVIDDCDSTIEEAIE